MRRSLVTALLALAALAVAAVAPAAPAARTIVAEGSLTVPVTSTPPCLGTATITYREAYRLVDTGHSLHIVDNESGTFAFVSDVDGRTYTGRYGGTFLIQANANEQFVLGGTFRLVGRADDGSSLRFMINTRVTFPAISPHAGDDPLVEFTRISCSLD